MPFIRMAELESFTDVLRRLEMFAVGGLRLRSCFLLALRESRAAFHPVVIACASLVGCVMCGPPPQLSESTAAGPCFLKIVYRVSMAARSWTTVAEMR